MNFLEVLNKKVDDIERPPLMPVGTYRWVVKGYSTDTIANGDWDVVDFNLECIEPMQDVDEDDLKAYGTVQGRRQRHRFMFNTQDQVSFDRTLFGLKRFLEEHLQIDGADKMDLKEALANAVNHQCLATIVWTQDKKDPSGETHFDNIGKTAPVE